MDWLEKRRDNKKRKRFENLIQEFHSKKEGFEYVPMTDDEWEASKARTNNYHPCGPKGNQLKREEKLKKVRNVLQPLLLFVSGIIATLIAQFIAYKLGWL